MADTNDLSAPPNPPDSQDPSVPKLDAPTNPEGRIENLDRWFEGAACVVRSELAAAESLLRQIDAHVRRAEEWQEKMRAIATIIGSLQPRTAEVEKQVEVTKADVARAQRVIRRSGLRRMS